MQHQCVFPARSKIIADTFIRTAAHKSQCNGNPHNTTPILDCLKI